MVTQRTEDLYRLFLLCQIAIVSALFWVFACRALSWDRVRAREMASMKKKSTSRSAGARALIALILLAVAGCLVATGTLPASFRPEAAAKVSKRTLTFAERVAYQRAIEEVYWRHRIWPKDNPVPKPSLDAIVSQREIEKKVEDYLRKSQVVTEQRGSPITASELQVDGSNCQSHETKGRIARTV